MRIVLLILLLACPTAEISGQRSTGRMRTDGSACPSIADHQRFVRELEKGNFTYRYPDQCVALPPGTRVAGPLQRKTAEFGKSTGEFVLIELEGGRTLWTLASWVDFDQGSTVRTGPSPVALSEATVWFAREIRRRFGDEMPLSGTPIPLREVACLPVDITRFVVTPAATGGVLILEGELIIGALPSGFSAFDGAQGRRYMVQIEAFLFSPTGELVWQQTGYPVGGAWIDAGGQSVLLRIVNPAPSTLPGHDLLLIAIGNPIRSDLGVAQAVLGGKRVSL